MKTTKLDPKKRPTSPDSEVPNEPKIGLEVRKGKELLPDEIEKIKRAELYDYGKLEAWTALGTNKQLGYATHGAMRFFGKFPPPVATYLIDQYTTKNSLVIDPMGG